MPYLIILNIAVGLIAGSWYQGYQHGKKIERAEWVEKNAQRDALLANELGEAMAAKARIEDENTDNLMRIIDDKDAALDKLNRDLVNTRGLYIRAKNTSCPANAVPGKAESTGESGGGAGRERLPEPVEAGLWKLAADAQKVVIQYETCRQALRPLVEVVD